MNTYTNTFVDLNLVAEQYRVTSEFFIVAAFHPSSGMEERARSRPRFRLLGRQKRHPTLERRSRAPSAPVQGASMSGVRVNRRGL